MDEEYDSEQDFVLPPLPRKPQKTLLSFFGSKSDSKSDFRNKSNKTPTKRENTLSIDSDSNEESSVKLRKRNIKIGKKIVSSDEESETDDGEDCGDESDSKSIFEPESGKKNIDPSNTKQGTSTFTDVPTPLFTTQKQDLVKCNIPTPFPSINHVQQKHNRVLSEDVHKNPIFLLKEVGVDIDTSKHGVESWRKINNHQSSVTIATEKPITQRRTVDEWLKHLENEYKGAPVRKIFHQYLLCQKKVVMNDLHRIQSSKLAVESIWQKDSEVKIAEQAALQLQKQLQPLAEQRKEAKDIRAMFAKPKKKTKRQSEKNKRDSTKDADFESASKEKNFSNQNDNNEMENNESSPRPSRRLSCRRSKQAENEETERVDKAKMTINVSGLFSKSLNKKRLRKRKMNADKEETRIELDSKSSAALVDSFDEEQLENSESMETDPPQQSVSSEKKSTDIRKLFQKSRSGDFTQLDQKSNSEGKNHEKYNNITEELEIPHQGIKEIKDVKAMKVNDVQEGEDTRRSAEDSDACKENTKQQHGRSKDIRHLLGKSSEKTADVRTVDDKQVGNTENNEETNVNKGRSKKIQNESMDVEVVNGRKDADDSEEINTNDMNSKPEEGNENDSVSNFITRKKKKKKNLDFLKIKLKSFVDIYTEPDEENERKVIPKMNIKSMFAKIQKEDSPQDNLEEDERTPNSGSTTEKEAPIKASSDCSRTRRNTDNEIANKQGQESYFDSQSQNQDGISDVGSKKKQAAIDEGSQSSEIRCNSSKYDIRSFFGGTCIPVEKEVRKMENDETAKEYCESNNGFNELKSVEGASNINGNSNKSSQVSENRIDTSSNDILKTAENFDINGNIEAKDVSIKKENAEKLQVEVKEEPDSDILNIDEVSKDCTTPFLNEQSSKEEENKKIGIGRRLRVRAKPCSIESHVDITCVDAKVKTPQKTITQTTEMEIVKEGKMDMQTTRCKIEIAKIISPTPCIVLATDVSPMLHDGSPTKTMPTESAEQPDVFTFDGNTDNDYKPESKNFRIKRKRTSSQSAGSSKKLKQSDKYVDVARRRSLRNRDKPKQDLNQNCENDCKLDSTYEKKTGKTEPEFSTEKNNKAVDMNSVEISSTLIKQEQQSKMADSKNESMVYKHETDMVERNAKMAGRKERRKQSDNHNMEANELEDNKDNNGTSLRRSSRPRKLVNYNESELRNNSEDKPSHKENERNYQEHPTDKKTKKMKTKEISENPLELKSLEDVKTATNPLDEVVICDVISSVQCGGSKIRPMNAIMSSLTPKKSKPTIELVLNEETMNSFLSWTEKYQPMKARYVIGDKTTTKQLFNWLCSWKERHEMIVKKMAERAAMKKSKAADMDSDFYSDEDEELLTNTLLLTGPTGCGTTAAVNACAKQMDFKVLEINPTIDRTGRRVFDLVYEAVVSHQVQKGITKTKTQKRGGGGGGRKVDSNTNGSSSSANLSNFFQRDQKGTGKNTEKRIIPSEEIRQDPLTQDAMSLVLFEQCDIYYEERDRGFWQGVADLRKLAKRPIILTANDEKVRSIIETDDVPLEYLSMCYPDNAQILPMMQLLCLVEQTFVPSTLLQAIVNYCGNDVRRTLLQLHFWFDLGGEPLFKKWKNTKSRDSSDVVRVSEIGDSEIGDSKEQHLEKQEVYEIQNKTIEDINERDVVMNITEDKLKSQDSADQTENGQTHEKEICNGHFRSTEQLQQKHQDKSKVTNVLQDNKCTKNKSVIEKTSLKHESNSPSFTSFLEKDKICKQDQLPIECMTIPKGHSPSITDDFEMKDLQSIGDVMSIKNKQCHAGFENKHEEIYIEETSMKHFPAYENRWFFHTEKIFPIKKTSWKHHTFMKVWPANSTISDELDKLLSVSSCVDALSELDSYLKPGHTRLDKDFFRRSSFCDSLAESPSIHLTKDYPSDELCENVERVSVKCVENCLDSKHDLTCELQTRLNNFIGNYDDINRRLPTANYLHREEIALDVIPFLRNICESEETRRTMQARRRQRRFLHHLDTIGMCLEDETKDALTNKAFELVTEN